jgi:uncharacterized membrane-anchored protein YhcB (DUF1043 family)
MELSEAVITALITGGLALIGVWLTNRKSTEMLFAKLDKQSELSDAKLDTEIRVVKTQIDELTREVRKHNNFAERVPVMEEQIKVANHRIEDLERRGE